MKTYTDDDFWIIGQARFVFDLNVLESVYTKTLRPVLCKQNEFVFSWTLQLRNSEQIPIGQPYVQSDAVFIISRDSIRIWFYIFSSLFSRYPTFHTLTNVGRKDFHCAIMFPLFLAIRKFCITNRLFIVNRF